MIFNYKLVPVYLLFCLLTTRCKKDYSTSLISGPTTSINTILAKNTSKANQKDTLKFGSGFGILVIDGSITSVKKNQIITIMAGSYSEIDIKNIQANPSDSIVVTNKGLVELVGKLSSMNVSNVSGITISGGGTKGIQKGFYFHDNAYRALLVNGNVQNTNFQFLRFKNIGDYTIYVNNTMVYDGTDATTFKNLSFNNCSLDNCGGIQFGGNISNGKVVGLLRNLEFGMDSIINSSYGVMVWGGAIDQYNLHNNYFNNINANNNNHNAMFLMTGNGRLYNNYVGPHQGNTIRAWSVSFSKVPEQILIYNNIVLDSRKYSGFEVQSFSNYAISGLTTFANAYVFHNTVGNLNLTQNWIANIVDIYGLFGGTIRVDNNLGFNFYPIPKTDSFSNLSIPQESKGNLYFDSSTSAGFDETNLMLVPSSKALGTGTPDSLQVIDFYGKPRSLLNPSVGAVEN